MGHPAKVCKVAAVTRAARRGGADGVDDPQFAAVECRARERRRYGATPKVNMLRGLAARATTPLLPDDYLKLLNPLWSARELRGQVVAVQQETEDSASVTIKPGWGFSGDYQPGQYVGIGLRIDGRWHWRSYSLTSIPQRDKKLISITVKATPEGFLSTHLVNGVEPGTIVRLAAPKGDFALPDPPPPKLLFVTAGSGITPDDGNAAHAAKARAKPRHRPHPLCPHPLTRSFSTTNCVSWKRTSPATGCICS